MAKIKIEETPMLETTYLGTPREGKKNLHFSTKKDEFTTRSVRLHKVNFCCGIAELGNFNVHLMDVFDSKETTIPLIQQAIEKAVEWGKGVITCTITGLPEKAFLEKNFGFKEIMRFKNPNSGNVVYQLAWFKEGCELPKESA